MSETVNFSSILLIGQSLPKQEAFEMTHFSDLESALEVLTTHAFKLLIIHLDPLAQEQVRSLYKALSQMNQPPEILILLNSDQNSDSKLLTVSLLNPLSIIQSDQSELIQQYALKAVQKFDYHKQNENFYKLFEEQNQNLQKLNAELKEGVRKRKVSLKRSQSRLIRLQQQLNLMYFAIVGIQDSKSISEIEELLVKILSANMDVTWVRILIDQKEILEEAPIIESQRHFNVFGSALVFDKNKIGHIYFAKSTKNFSKQQESFLLQINEIVSIKINQLIKYSDLLITRSQWQQTFNAIKHPVVIINKNYDYITSNQQSLEERHKQHPKCYQVMFGRDQPCQGCHLGEKFEFKDTGGTERWYYVTSQSLKAYYEDSENLLHIYQDITEQKNIETQIIEKTKLTDLGVLAGSLAHELNNPLGGVITFLQLLIEDIDESDENLKTDINDLLKSAIDCKHIIQMILENVRHNKPLSLS